MEESIFYNCRWSNSLDEKFIEDFRTMCSTVFNYNFTFEEFRRKFLDNIYGESLLIVVYIDGKPCAARALWRNDINGFVSYQLGDACVLDSCRGKGIFSQMTIKAVAMLPKNALIYSFPNHYSFPGHLKMGMLLLHDYHQKLLTSYKNFVLEHPQMMDDKYFSWWIKGRNLMYTKCDGHYFLICKDNRPFCYRVIAEVSKKNAQQFPYRRLGLFFYKSKDITWYNKRFAASHVVTRNPEIGYIPIWKIDAL